MPKTTLAVSVLLGALVFLLAGCQAPGGSGPSAQGGGGAARADRNFVVEPAVSSGRKLALVIGNDDYPNAPLSNPVHDAEDMARTLKGLGFDIVGGKALPNLNLEQMNGAVRDFGDALRNGGVGLFYFAGHGMQVKGRNYLILIGSGIQRDDEVPYRAFDANQVLAKMDSARNGLNLMILDACRNNPFERSFRTDEVGLASMNAPKGTLILYSAKPGTKSRDDDGSGRNGLYTGTLLKYLGTKGLSIERMHKRVAIEVIHVSKDLGQEQIPWQEGYLLGTEDFCFAGCLAEGPTPTPVPVVPTPTPTPRPAPAPAPPPTPPPYTPPPPPACDYCPEMVRIPGEEFMMGSPPDETGGDADERPRHRVRVGAFSLGKYEVTRAQFAAFVQATGHQATDCYAWNGKQWEKKEGASWRSPGYAQEDTHPAVCVSFNDAVAYARWLSRTTGRSYRLPTEAEWEYAARAGTTTARYWGNDPDAACGYANVGDQAAKRTFTNWTIHECSDGYVYTAPVGSFRANRFGLHDMLGNAWEWTCSAYTEGGYDGSEGQGTNDAKARRAVRGGSWLNKPVYVRSAHRDGNDPGNRFLLQGFRLA